MSLSAAERETIARFSDDPNEPLTIYTGRRAAARTLLAAGARLIRHDVFGFRLEVPRSWFRWPKPPRVLSAAQLEVARRARQAASRRLATADAVATRRHPEHES
jgi:hypothetical protein